MTLLLRNITLIACSIAGLAIAAPAQTPAVQQDGWLEDLEQIQREMALHYATFQDQVRDRRMDLVRLAGETKDELLRAQNADAARLAFRRFLGAFGDAHLSIREPGSGSNQNASPICTRLGYGDEPSQPGIAFRLLEELSPIANADARYFPIGILNSPKRRVGVIRIGVFEPLEFHELCESAIATLKIDSGGPCDRNCAKRIDLFASDMLTAALARQARVLQNAHIDALVVDITGNPGGTDWGEPAARTLTPLRIPGSPYGFIRHPHWIALLSADLATIERDLPRTTGGDRERLEFARKQLQTALTEAGKPCDLMPLWRNETVTCSMVVDSIRYVTGLLPYASPGTLPRLPSSEVLFMASRFAYEEGVYSGPLIVMVDGNTGSSAERFAAMLQDNGAATVIGMATAGAGCGFTGAGIPVTLRTASACCSSV